MECKNADTNFGVGIVEPARIEAPVRHDDIDEVSANRLPADGMNKAGINPQVTGSRDFFGARQGDNAF